MKTIYSILLFLCFAVKPIYNVGYVAYFELNLDDIVQKYCVNKSEPVLKCNGKCHLSKKLLLTTSLDNSSSEKISTSLSEAFIPVFFQKIETNIKFLGKINLKEEHNFFIRSKYQISLTIPSPPPQLS